MLRIRLKRCGRKHAPSYRIVLAPSRARRDGKAIEELGYYNPLRNQLEYKKERILVRIQQGAKPSQTVKNFLIKAGVLSKTGKILVES
uniref:Ribosomal protein S16 n=1 Tax=Eustigmatophyceae sp. Mont 10/10-1w TaxID=2506145 RepID=A0A451FMV5_9STRA|nr:ribosomal protein S16 [Eustigmatophyceae sp. Mont 10/10-1w]QAA11751.1 ribosomal protein S16 [Eustigmatophyceae sp. Mont 10/10-1w]